jgi:small ligand-binding sensory domain FIST
LQIDCAGRGAQLYGDAVTPRLITPVQREIGEDLPWIGFHSYGEIAPIGGRNLFHQYTMALGAFYDTLDGQE